MKRLLLKKKVFIGAAAFLMVLAGGIYAATAWHRIRNDQMSLFEQSPAPTVAAAEPAATPEETEPAPAPTPTPTPDPYDVLAAQADRTIMQDTLNVLLIGVDYAAEREDNDREYVNKDFNSDVMLNLAVNFRENKVDMISCPGTATPRSPTSPASTS